MQQGNVVAMNFKVITIFPLGDFFPLQVETDYQLTFRKLFRRAFFGKTWEVLSTKVGERGEEFSFFWQTQARLAMRWTGPKMADQRTKWVGGEAGPVPLWNTSSKVGLRRLQRGILVGPPRISGECICRSVAISYGQARKQE